MGDKGLDFKHKEVININDGKRLGYVQDVCADLQTGIITSIIVPGGNNKLLNIFASNNDIVIPWQNIKCISDDLILVEI
jgi:YlmC/YmxH family sporulation protein